MAPTALQPSPRPSSPSSPALSSAAEWCEEERIRDRAGFGDRNKVEARWGRGVGRASPSPSIEHSDSASSDDDEDKPDSAYNPPCTLQVDYWKRTPEVQQRKDDHIARIDSGRVSREDQILSTTLRNQPIALEENMFPYACPNGIRHYTLWSLKELTHRQICRFVEGYCRQRVPGQVLEWNYEENSHRSIDIPHVHVFLQFKLDFSTNSMTTPGTIPTRSPSERWGKHNRVAATAALHDRPAPPGSPPLHASLHSGQGPASKRRNTEPRVSGEEIEGGDRLGKRPRHQLVSVVEWRFNGGDLEHHQPPRQRQGSSGCRFGWETWGD